LGAVKNLAELAAPASLSDAHQLDAFRCSEPDLEVWLKQRARKNQLEGASRTFVVCAGHEVVGYYCLPRVPSSTGGPGSIRRNMPDPIPVASSVDSPFTRLEGQGRIRAPKGCHVRTCTAEDMGIRALLAHALHDKAKQFYLHHGFVESPIEALTVMLNIAKLAKIT
jgi:hypothetical protein